MIADEIERMQHELNDLEYAIRTRIDVEVSREQKQNKKNPKLGNLKDILMIELSGGGKRKKKSALPDNQTLINGFFSEDSKVNKRSESQKGERHLNFTILS